jgi:hypothetical protein
MMPSDWARPTGIGAELSRPNVHKAARRSTSPSFLPMSSSDGSLAARVRDAFRGRGPIARIEINPD